MRGWPCSAGSSARWCWRPSIITIAVIGSAMFQTDQPREIIPLTARTRPAGAGGRDPAGRRLRQGDLDRQQLSVLAGQQPDSRRLQAVHRSECGRAADADRLARAGDCCWACSRCCRRAYFESILKAALYAYTVYGAAVTPAVMAVFFWKRANTAGAISSIIAGNRDHGGVERAADRVAGCGLSGAGGFAAGADRA